MATEDTGRVDLDLTHTIRLLHDAEQQGRLDDAATCWQRIDALLDKRWAATSSTATVPA